MAITRANPFLEEIIETLDAHRSKWKSDAEAIDHLTKADSDWIDDELVHCMVDARYFISNYYAYRDEKEGFRGLYPLFDSQEILYEEYRKLEASRGNVRALVLKARQMGSTTYNCAEFFHKTIFSEHVNSIIVAQDEDTSEYVMGMYESALDFIPWWMRPRIKAKQTGSLINFDERDDAVRTSRPGLKSWVYADNARKPTGVGRSKTFGRALLTELAFWPNGSQLSKSFFPTMNTPDGFYVMESTANGRNDFWHNLWRRAESGKIDWHPIFIPFYRREKTYSLPIADGKEFKPKDDEIEFRTRIMQKEGYLVRDEMLNWIRNKKEEFVAVDGDDMMFSQEYTSEPEESFQSSAITAIPRPVINRYSKRVIEPKWIGEIEYDFEAGRPKAALKPLAAGEEAPYPETFNRFHVWEKPVRGERYACGVDVSLGNPGGDYSCIQVIKLSSGHQLDEQVASWHGLIDPEGLAEIVLAVCWMYNEALAAVEVNSMGMLTNNTLVRNFEYENIYRFKRLDRLRNFMTDIMGFWTDEKSKRALLAKMTKSMRDDQIILRDRYLIDELRDFTEEGSEGEGAHDDFVMAAMIALYCGHEGEINERQKPKATAPESPNVYRVVDRWGTKIAETTSQNESQRISGRHPGSTVQMISGKQADLVVNGKSFKVPGTQQNTEFSPVHDKEGPAHDLHYDEGVPAEDIDQEMMAEYERQMEELENSPDAWKYT